MTALRARPETRLVPVVVFSDSHNGEEIRRSYTCGANSFVTKPADYADFARAVTEIAAYWVGRNRLD